MMGVRGQEAMTHLLLYIKTLDGCVNPSQITSRTIDMTSLSSELSGQPGRAWEGRLARSELTIMSNATSGKVGHAMAMRANCMGKLATQTRAGNGKVSQSNLPGHTETIRRQ